MHGAHGEAQLAGKDEAGVGKGDELASSGEADDVLLSLPRSSQLPMRPPRTSTTVGLVALCAGRARAGDVGFALLRLGCSFNVVHRACRGLGK